MVNDLKKENMRENVSIGSRGEHFEKSRKSVETYFLISLFLLISSIILISFDLRLIAGITAILAASLMIAIFRKSSVIYREFLKTVNSLNSINNRKDEVIKHFSHKIREPLNTIVIISDILTESEIAQGQKDLLASLSESSNNMVDTVNELTKNTAGSMLYEHRKPIRFDIISTVNSSIDLYSQKDRSGLRFFVVKDDPEALEFYGDPVLIKQLLVNVFTTIDSKSDGQPIEITITVKKDKETKTDTYISFIVETNREITLINESGSAESQTDRLISYHKWGFKQKLSEGHSKLNIVIPFTNPSGGLKPKASSTKIEELIMKEKTSKVMKDLKVLLVEDNIINQKITILTLKPLVKSIDTAENGKEALDKFGTSNYDLILMDIQMPLMSGLIAAEKIRALESTTHSHIPIIAITANAMIGDRERCISAGIDEYISKPFQPAVLIELIKKTI